MHKAKRNGVVSIHKGLARLTFALTFNKDQVNLSFRSQRAFVRRTETNLTAARTFMRGSADLNWIKALLKEKLPSTFPGGMVNEGMLMSINQTTKI